MEEGPSFLNYEKVVFVHASGGANVFMDFHFKFHASGKDLIFHDMLDFIQYRIERAFEILADVCVTSAFDPGVNRVVLIAALHPEDAHMFLCFVGTSLWVVVCRVHDSHGILQNNKPDE